MCSCRLRLVLLLGFPPSPPSPLPPKEGGEPAAASQRGPGPLPAGERVAEGRVRGDRCLRRVMWIVLLAESGGGRLGRSMRRKRPHAESGKRIHIIRLSPAPE